MSAQAVIDVLYAHLQADTGAGGLANATGGVGNRIFPVEGKQNAPLPHLSFWVVTSNPQRYMGGAIALDLTVQFDIYADKRLGADVADDIESKLYARLESQVTTSAPSGFDRALCTFNSRGAQQVEEDAIRITDEVRIQATDF